MTKLADQIQAMLEELPPHRLTAGFSREAAVLMLIFEKADSPHFLLTLRTEAVSTHKGQVSFPGGMRQDEESLQETALRETEEEIGIRPHQIRMLGRFHDYLSVTDHRVAPFVGVLEEPFRTVAHKDEVAEVLEVPWRIFMDPECGWSERMERRGSVIDVYHYRYESRDVWGLTAHMIRDFLNALAKTRAWGDIPSE